jgi:hypothetical protein
MRQRDKVRMNADAAESWPKLIPQEKSLGNETRGSIGSFGEVPTA